MDNDRSIDSVIGERVPANIRASSRGKTEGASVIHKKKVSKGWKTEERSRKEDSGMYSGRMESIEIVRNIESEGSYLRDTDVKGRRFGEQIGLETLVVRTVNDEWKGKHYA